MAMVIAMIPGPEPHECDGNERRDEIPDAGSTAVMIQTGCGRDGGISRSAGSGESSAIGRATDRRGGWPTPRLLRIGPASVAASPGISRLPAAVCTTIVASPNAARPAPGGSRHAAPA